MEENKKQKHISEFIHLHLHEIFVKRSLNILSGALVSVKEVQLSADGKWLNIYISVFPTEQKDAVSEQLNISQKDVKADLVSRIKNRLRHMPDIRFILDEGEAHRAHMDELLKDL